MPLGRRVGCQTSLRSWRAEGLSRRSTGLSEAEDWLGREAARLLGDSEGHSYSTQAVAKNRKPSTWRGRSSLGAPRAAHPAPVPEDPRSGEKTFFPAEP